MAKSKEIFISVESQETRVAVVEDGRMEEYYVERPTDTRMVGSIYKGKVTSIVPGINAAFVDIGLGKNGFLYVSDIIETKPDDDVILDEEQDKDKSKDKERRPSRKRSATRMRIESLLKINQEILVQVVKEPFGTKGARLTTHLSLPGRYMVLMCNDPRLGISKRIDDSAERMRLKEILTKIRFSKDAGLIVRTAGIGKSQNELSRDVRYLSKIYQRIKRMSSTSKPSACIYQEYELSQRVIRDSFTEDVKRIVVDSKEEFHKLRRFLPTLIPGVKVRLEHYRSEVPLYEKEGLDEQIVDLFNKRVELPSGGFIIIEPTEAMVTIDVNTGKFTGRRNLEETAFQVNKESAIEVARQLRLRDIGGIVVIDFIDLDIHAHRRTLVKTLEDALTRDRAKTNLVSFSEICVAELTRQRMRRSVETVTHQTCPYCSGRGHIKSVITIGIEAVRQAKKALKNSRNKTLELIVHPQVAIRLLQDDRASLRALEQKMKARILIMSDPGLHHEQIKTQFTT